MRPVTLASCRFGLTFFVVAGLFAASADARIWTNKKGQKIEADYVKAENGMVQLQRNGQVYNIPIASLSEADQLLVGDDLFTRKLRENPQDPDAYVRRAMALANRDNYEDAMRNFNRAIELNPKHAEAYDGRGLTYSKVGQPLQAHKDFDKAIELDRKLAMAYRHRGENYKALANTADGKLLVDKKVENYRQSHAAARREQFKRLGWQPLNSTSGNVTRYGAIGMLAKADFELAEKIERGYDIGGCDCGGAGCAHCSGGGVGVGSGPGYPAVGEVAGDPALAMYPAKVVQGETMTLVANPAELAKGMPQQLGADGKPIRSAYGKSPKEKMQVGSVDFYRDVNGDGELDPDADQLLGSDAIASDGFSIEVSTSQFPPGPQNFFASPTADQAAGLSLADMKKLAESLETAAAAEKEIAAKSASAAEAAGLSAEEAQKLTEDNEKSVSEVCEDCEKSLGSALPEIAKMVADAGKPVRAVGNLMKAASTKPGEESKEKVASAGEKANDAAEKLAAAAAKLREMAESGEVPKAQGSPIAGRGEILPPTDQVAKGPGPGPGPGKPGPGAPGSDSGGKDGYDDDDTVVIDDDDDRVIVIDDDDDDLIVIDDDDDRAIVDYDRVLVDDPDNVIVRRDRAGAYLNRGSYDYAIRDYDLLLQDRAIAIEQQIDFYYNRGCAHLAASNLDDAIADFTASIELKEIGPSAYMAFNNRGIAYAKKGDFAEALNNFNRAIEINANDVLAYKNRALAYKKLGKTVEAEQDMAKVNDLSGL